MGLVRQNYTKDAYFSFFNTQSGRTDHPFGHTENRNSMYRTVYRALKTVVYSCREQADGRVRAKHLPDNESLVVPYLRYGPLSTNGVRSTFFQKL